MDLYKSRTHFNAFKVFAVLPCIATLFFLKCMYCSQSSIMCIALLMVIKLLSNMANKIVFILLLLCALHMVI